LLPPPPPAPDLADQLVCVWRGDLGQAAMPLPDERLDLVWVDDGSLWLSGPETTSWPRGYGPGTTAVGVGFKPGVGPPLLGLAAAEVCDARVGLAELWGDRHAGELAERVAAQPDDRERARELERAVRGLAAGARPVDQVALEVAARLNQPRAVLVADLSGAMGLSERQIHRRCMAAFGYGPGVLARMLRLRRALQLARSQQGGTASGRAGGRGWLFRPAAPGPRGPGHHGDHAGQAPAFPLMSDLYKTRPPGPGMIPQALSGAPVSPGLPAKDSQQAKEQARMLKDAKALSGFSVDDVTRAKEFYGTTLGLEVVDASLGVEGTDVPAGLEIHLGPGTKIRIYPKPDHTPASFTILTFMVEDIERAVDALTARGVRFEHYDSPKTDAKGIHRTPEVQPVAWFQDPAGNILSIIQE
jgi:catechol 2,3-dioxygenase-like lactoylglutathione lyase family enzyme/AraC-like DNA-binding protein